MLSSKSLQRIASGLKESGFWGIDDDEDYVEVYNLIESSLQELYKALDLREALNIDGYQRLMDIINTLREYQRDFDSLKVITLRNPK